MPNEFNPKTPIDYMLGKLSEEAAEIIQAIEKIRTFGLDEKYPSTGITNIGQLQLEIFDFTATQLQLNVELNALGKSSLRGFDLEAVTGKINRLHAYSKFSIENGMLAEPLSCRPVTFPTGMD